MTMNIKRKIRSGLTLVELMLAAAILMIALVGSMAYRYYSTLDARKADVQMTASRAAMTLLENWLGAKGLDATPAFDPTLRFPVSDYATNGVKVETATAGPSVPSDFTQYGLYKITTADGMIYTALLASKAADTTTTPATPRVLSVQIGWRHDRQAGVPDKVAGFTSYMDN